MYQFRREDNGQIVLVDFAQMMEKDALGIITLPDGCKARQVHQEIQPRPKESSEALDRPIVSDALGFGQHQFAEMEADRKLNGFSGVEFVRDPQVPEFFQVKVGSRREWLRYMKHRGFHDRNKTLGSGATLTQGQLDAAIARAKEGWPVA